MIGLIQRVSEAAVRVDGETVGRIGPGLLLLLGVERGDGGREAARLLDKVLGYRVFNDAAGKMNRSLKDTGGGLLIVSQFTLPADTRKGLRAGFHTCAPPEEGRRLYDAFCAGAQAVHPDVATGVFGAMMQVSLVNDGPVTFWLRVAPGADADT